MFYVLTLLSYLELVFLGRGGEKIKSWIIIIMRRENSRLGNDSVAFDVMRWHVIHWKHIVTVVTSKHLKINKKETVSKRCINAYTLWDFPLCRSRSVWRSKVLSHCSQLEHYPFCMKGCHDSEKLPKFCMKSSIMLKFLFFCYKDFLTEMTVMDSMHNNLMNWRT